jgi:hypothetical protein
MILKSQQAESFSFSEKALFESETVDSSEAISLYFGLRHGRKHCSNCNAKTYFYFYTYLANGKIFGWRRCGKCMSDHERLIVRALYKDVLPATYRLEYFKRRSLNNG